MNYRKATVDDANLLMEWRKIQLVEEGIKAIKILIKS